jgi:hypothetical protein
MRNQSILVGKLSCLVFGVYAGAVDRHVEDTAAAWDQIGINLKPLSQFRSQTDRLGTIVSGTAVGN